MAELHVMGALRNKRAELAGTLRQLKQQLEQQRVNLAHVDATTRLFDPAIRPNDIRPKQQRARNAWFRQGESRPYRRPITIAVNGFRKHCSLRSTGPRRRSRASRPQAWSVGG